MTIHQKLERLLEMANKSAVSRKAGLSQTGLHNLIARRSQPGAGTVLNLARALGVDPGWLIDDSKGWPPVRVESPEPATSSAA